MRIPQALPNWSEIPKRKTGDLMRAISDARVLALVEQADATYRHWDRVRRIARQEGVDPEVFWCLLKLRRVSGLRLTEFRSTRGRRLSYNVPDIVQRELMLVDQQLAGRITIGRDDVPTREQEERFVVSSLMDEAIASSMLEGASTTVRVAKGMLRAGRRPRTRGERMVLNNYRAVQFAREHAHRDLDERFLLELQEMLTENTLDESDQVGRFRTEADDVVVQDHEGVLLHSPPSAIELNERIARICAFANEDATAEDKHFIHPLVRAVLLHFQLAYVHPFCDGNGRTARVVFLWSMLRAGYWMFAWLPVSKVIYEAPAQYERAFLYTETDEFDATYFLVFHARAIARCRRLLAAYLERKRHELKSAMSRFVDEPGLNHRQRALLSHAIRHPGTSYTIESHQNSHGVAYATARADLFGLTDSNFLTRRKVGHRFIFTEGPKVISAKTGLE